MSKLQFLGRGTRTTALVMMIVLALDVLLTSLVLPDNLFGVIETERLARIYSPLYHHDLAPNREIENARWGALRYNFSTNSLGFKDRVIRNVPLKSNNRRLLLIGDSFTEGNGYTFDDTFAGMIDRQLKQSNSHAPGEVLNAAVSSYSPAIYYRKVRHLLEERSLSVDAVAVFIDISDIDDEARRVRLNVVGNVVSRGINAGDAAVQKATLLIRSALKQYSSVYRLFSALNRQRKATLTHANTCQRALAKANPEDDHLSAKFFLAELANPRSQWTWNPTLMKAWGERGLDQSGQNMTRLHNFLDARGIPLIVVVYPWPEQILRQETDRPQVEYWRQWAADHDVDFLDLYPTFLNGGEPLSVYRRYFVPCDVHWNREGHSLIAERFMAFFRSLDLKAFPADSFAPR